MAVAMAKIVTGTTTGATPSLFRKTSACRSLFGEIDHEEVRRDLNQEMDRIYTDDQERWNFNFREGTPLQGRYTWQEMTPETDSVPKPYENLLARLTATVVVQRIANTASESSSSSSTETTATTQSISTQTDCDIKPVTKKNPVRSSRRFRVDTTKLKQSKLSAFMKVTKRKRTDSECSSSLPSAKLLKLSSQEPESNGESTQVTISSS